MVTEGSIFVLFVGPPIALIATVIACLFLNRRLRSKGRPTLAKACLAVGATTAIAFVVYAVTLGDFHMFVFRSWFASLR